MRRTPPLALVLLLTACAGGRAAPPAAAESAPVLSSTVAVAPAPAAEPAAPAPDIRSRPLAAGLPATVSREAPMRAQPLPAATALRSLPAGTAVRVLASLDNASGRWLNVQLGDTVGWLPATQVEYTH
ncbi:MAG: hypothetical protein Q8Q73_18820 [Stagnimonas sp.]|nr:hypothetical protein [Stagnimonas sp.]